MEGMPDSRTTNMTQGMPITSSTEVPWPWPWSGFSSRGYSEPQPRESARRTFSLNRSGNEWGEVRQACKDQQLVSGCYKVSITDRTMCPQLVKIVDSLDLGYKLKVDGVFEKFMFGFTRDERQAGCPEGFWIWATFLLPGGDRRCQATNFDGSEEVQWKGDIVGFEQTRYSPEGVPYHLTFMRDYSLGSEDLVNVGVVWGLDSSYTITGYKFRGAAVATKDVVKSYH